MSSYIDKKKRESKLQVLRDLGPASPGEFTHDEEGKELPKKKKKSKKKKKEMDVDVEDWSTVPSAKVLGKN
jgi:hypothetical protein